MSRLSKEEEKEIILFIKDWLKSNGLSQKDLAGELNLKSSRTSEISIKIKEFYKKGGIFNVAKNLIKIEQNLLNNLKVNYKVQEEIPPYSQLDIDSLVNQIERDSS